MSYGPFQIGDLASGALREVRGKVLRDQLGAKLAAAAGVDFEAPVREPAPPPPTAAKTARQGRVPRPRRPRGADRRR
jgi:23S rRNA pseudouridine2605 synthase